MKKETIIREEKKSNKGVKILAGIGALVLVGGVVAKLLNDSLPHCEEICDGRCDSCDEECESRND